MGMLSDIWNYRGFILGSVKREFQLKYRNSLLGAAWTVLNPLAMILVYTVIFSQVMQNRLPGNLNKYSFSIYLCSGLLTWNLFSEIVGRSQTMFLEHANLIKKINFPRICLPIIVVLNACLNFWIVFGIFTLFLIGTGNFPGWAFIAIFPLLLLQVFFAIGLGVSIGVLNVFFRDIGQFFNIFLQFWFWLTPVVYVLSIVSPKIQAFMYLNPMTGLIQSYQGIFVEGQWPDWPSLFPLATISFALCLLGLRLFRSRIHEMEDEL
jgi:lipopolysaccharide transport system permease protein